MGVSPVRVNLFDPTAVRKAVTGQDVVNLATHIPPSSMRMFLPGAWREKNRIRRDASRILADTADDAATAIVAALSIPAGIYNVTDDAPVRHREFVDSLAASLGVFAPKFPPAWFGRLGGSLGDTLARSLRISNRKLRTASNWAPKYASVREGRPAVVGALPRL